MSTPAKEDPAPAAPAAPADGPETIPAPPERAPAPVLGDAQNIEAEDVSLREARHSIKY
jgi:hypothetical protein